MLYVSDLQFGIHKAEKKFDTKFELKGPAGLFKDKNKHPICWKIAEICEKTCPFNVFTFHRKGNGSASSVMEDGVKLVQNILKDYPLLDRIRFSNE